MQIGRGNRFSTVRTTTTPGACTSGYSTTNCDENPDGSDEENRKRKKEKRKNSARYMYDGRLYHDLF